MLDNVSKIINTIFNIFIVVALSAMVLLVFTNAALRYLANTGIAEVEELGRYFFIWTVFLGTIAAFKDGQHVGVDVLIKTLKGTKLLVFKTIGYIAIFIALGVVLVGSISYVRTSMPSLGPATGIPFGIMAFSLTLAMVSMLSLVVVDMVKFYKNYGQKGE